MPRLIFVRRKIVAASTPASISLTANTTSTTDASSYTFSTQSIGTAAAGRRVIVAVGNTSVTAARTVSSLTIGGNAASSVVSQTAGPGTDSGFCCSAIYILQVDSGTTADIAITLSGSALRCGIGVWAAYDLTSSAAYDTGASTAEPSTDTLNIPAGGVAVGYVHTYAGSTTTWTNLTEDFDATVEGASNSDHSGASLAFAAAQTGLAITADNAGAANPRAFVIASFGT